jgi:hypothetical protein
MSHQGRTHRAATIAVLTTLLASMAVAQVYELRTYTTNEGKLPNLNARFRDHTIRLFEKHGMESVGYWIPTDDAMSRNTLIYILKHKDRDAAKASWKAFGQDPEWRKVAKESQLDGTILAKRPESLYMTPADLENPGFESREGEEAIFELRIYRCKEDALKDLLARFKAGTMRIFKKHGMGQVGYWHPADEPGAGDTLVYLLRHKDMAAKEASWKGFLSDPEWKDVRSKFGRPLREKPEVTLMKATDYSAIK